MSKERGGRVLVVDDEEGVRTFVAEALEREGHDVTQAADGAEGLREARRDPFDVVVTDLQMPVVDGMTMVRTLRTEQPDVEVIVLTAFGDVSTAVEAMKLGAFDFLEKPLPNPLAIRKLVAEAIARRSALTNSTRTPHAREPDGALAFGAPAMKPVVLAIEKVAKTSATVLLLGESGTGKEVTARAIHAKGSRAAAPFIAINCAVLTENLLESELFGHEKGAFTGAHAQRRGRIELADGGTFFLDEVAELHAGLQAKLLRVLEEREFERLGGSKPIHVDVRWIAATHRDLKSMVKDGKFREDLYHRLAVFPVRLPALRERREDILPLAGVLLREVAAAAERTPPRMSAEVEQRLVAAEWPGNARELKNALERALILADGGDLAVEHFDFAESADEDVAPPSGVPLEELERRAIVRTLAAVHGNRREAALKLGIGLRTLYDKLKRHQIR